MRKVSDCRDDSCPYSLFHPLSLHHNGRSIVPSEEHGFLLLQAVFTHTRVSETRNRMTMRVQIRPLASGETPDTFI
uniref:Uncharacterized protein n=1 Tax=Mycena chlorophos TaxID=658473 RepID=A0ABQ0LB52_MYCCL|nr:predicted protein [Mycena chlorophos]